MSTFSSLFSASRRSLTLAAFAGSAVLAAGAQTAPATSPVSTSQPVNFFAPAPAALNLTTPDSFLSTAHMDGFSSSSDGAGSDVAGENLAALEKSVNLPGLNAQYGRRRYGATRYRGGNTNADGSEKYTVFVGGGLTLPVSDTHTTYTPSWGFQVGAGRNFNKNFGVNLQFDWDEFGLQGNVLTQQGYIEDPLDEYGVQGNTDGYSHVWSVSVDPIYNLKSGEGLGAYVTGGVGFYHKITTFTTPVEGEGIDYYTGYPYEYVANEPYDSYTSNAPGVNGGFGLTYKFSKFANERLYAEVRYVHTFNTYKPGIDASNYNQYVAQGYYPTSNLFPANSVKSSYLPVKFGIRF